ncbi:MAG: tRNA (adenosine(37)-N6)-dimethylallyltransferase MiaA [Candidatus Nealsonbacteria bacterium]
MSKKLIVILGPTATGKSAVAVKLAQKFEGEVISADSRQIYREMDIATGKVTKKEMEGIPHYLLDVASPKKRFTLVQYRKLALKAIDKVFKKGKVPILCGGTGFYIQSIVDGILIPEVKPNWKLRSYLERLSPKDLLKILKGLDPKRAETIEKKNKRRLIRALEIIFKLKAPVPSLKKNPLPYPVLMIGVTKDDLNERIEKRYYGWFKQGFIKEVKNLREMGLSWQRIEEFGLHYRQASQYLQNKITYQEMTDNSLKELRNYAKRQMTWFKRDERIHWIKKQPEAERLVKAFLKTN